MGAHDTTEEPAVGRLGEPVRTKHLPEIADMEPPVRPGPGRESGRAPTGRTGPDARPGLGPPEWGRKSLARAGILPLVSWRSRQSPAPHRNRSARASPHAKFRGGGPGPGRARPHQIRRLPVNAHRRRTSDPGRQGCQPVRRTSDASAPLTLRAVTERSSVRGTGLLHSSVTRAARLALSCRFPRCRRGAVDYMLIGMLALARRSHPVAVTWSSVTTNGQGLQSRVKRT